MVTDTPCWNLQGEPADILRKPSRPIHIRRKLFLPLLKGFDFQGPKFYLPLQQKLPVTAGFKNRKSRFHNKNWGTPQSSSEIPFPRDSFHEEEFQGTNKTNNSLSIALKIETQKWTSNFLLEFLRSPLIIMLQDFIFQHPICLSKRELFGAVDIFHVIKGGKLS